MSLILSVVTSNNLALNEAFKSEVFAFGDKKFLHTLSS
jgi:hypothetical protein